MAFVLRPVKGPCPTSLSKSDVNNFKNADAVYRRHCSLLTSVSVKRPLRVEVVRNVCMFGSLVRAVVVSD